MANTPDGEAAAYELLERLRWGGAPRACPHCGAAGRSYFLRPRHAATRVTRTGTPTARRVWKCGACRRQFSVLVGTIFEGTRIAIRTWVAVVAECGTAGAPPAARHLADRYRVSGEAGRLLTRRVVLAMRCADISEPVGQPDGLLAALVNLPAEDVRRVRRLAPGRIRPRPQAGPTADYGAAR
jgi:hypothetical protein